MNCSNNWTNLLNIRYFFVKINQFILKYDRAGKNRTPIVYKRPLGRNIG